MRSQFLPGVYLASVLTGVIAGVALASWAPSFANDGVENICVAITVVAFLFVAIVFFTFKEDIGQKIFCLFLALIGGIVGITRYQSTGPGEQSVLSLAESEREIVAVVRSQEEADKEQKLVLRGVSVEGVFYRGGILATVPKYPQVPVGAKVRLTCDIEIPEEFDGFAYDKFLAAKRIYALCRTREQPQVVDPSSWRSPIVLLDKLHGDVVEVMEKIFGEPQSALLAGLLLGDNDFSEGWKDRFVATGTSHIVAASGTNVAIVASVLFSLAIYSGIRRQEAYPVILLGITAFVIVAGMEAAVTRAGIMAALVLTAKQTGRKTSPRNILLLTVAGMLLIEPRLLRDDVGFQLSVASTIGLLWLSKPFSEKLSWIPETLGLRESLATTLAATIATLPVVFIAFGRVVFVGPMANLFVLPFLPYAMSLGAAASVFGAVDTSLGAFLAGPAWVCLTAILELIRAFAAVPEMYSGIALGILLVFFTISFVRPPIAQQQDSPKRLHALLLPLVLFLLVTGALLVRQLWISGWPKVPGPSKSNDVTVWVFDVGQGDGIFIDGPERDVVLDGGPSSVMVEKISSVLPWWDRRIETMIVTHPHADHLAGLVPVLERYKIDEVLDDDQGYGTPEFEEYAKLAGDRRRVVAAGEVIQLGGGATLTAVWPLAGYEGDLLEDPNDGSLIFVLEAEGQKMLLTGDAGIAEEQAVLQAIGDIDVLKVGHHGSDTSTSQQLLTATTPEIAIISVGQDNSYGHPSEFVEARLQRLGAEIFRTDLQGDIRVTLGKTGVEIKTFGDIF